MHILKRSTLRRLKEKCMKNNAIEVRALKKNYGEFCALKGLTFHVKRGEIFALLGGNGAGKTTCLECLEGLRKYLFVFCCFIL